LTDLNPRPDDPSSSTVSSDGEDLSVIPSATRKRKSSPKATSFQRKRQKATQPAPATKRVSMGSSAKGKRSLDTSSGSPDFEGVQSILNRSQRVPSASASTSRNMAYTDTGMKSIGASTMSTLTSASVRKPSKIFP
jgi:hypothetical protein